MDIFVDARLDLNPAVDGRPFLRACLKNVIFVQVQGGWKI
jgi:hypothetical protein